VLLELLNVMRFVIGVARGPHGVHNLSPLLAETTQNRGMRMMLGFAMIVVGPRPL